MAAGDRAVIERLVGLRHVAQDIVWTPRESKNLPELRIRRGPSPVAG
jgi:hypothetical protein